MGDKERELTSKFLLGSLDISPITEKVSTWMLGGTGAAATLFLSNINDISLSIGKASVAYIFACLSISALFGLASKLNAVKSQNIKTLLSCVFTALDQHPDTNIEESLNDYMLSFPRWARGPVRKGAKKGRLDPLWGLRAAHKVVIYQNLYATFQGLLIVVAIAIVAISASNF